MDDPTLMGSVEGVGNLDGDVKDLSARQRLARDDVFESLAFQEFHRNEGMPFGIRQLHKWCRCWDGLRAEAARASR